MTSHQASAQVDAAPNADLETFGKRLTAAIQDANLPTLLAVMVHLTRDFSLLNSRFRPGAMRGAGDHDDAGLPDDLQADLRRDALEVIQAHRRGELPTLKDPTPAEIVQILSTCLDQQIPSQEGDLLAEELSPVARDPAPLTSSQRSSAPDVLVIGAGFSGLCAAIRLQQAGIPFTIIDKNTDLGGTWHENTYPGAGVDTPVHLYSYSFAQRPDWPRYFAGQSEMRDYIKQVGDEYGISRPVRYCTELSDAIWDDGACKWRVTLRGPDGAVDHAAFTAIISAVGQLNRPAIPAIEGLESFAGPALHTAQWEPSLQLAGKRVAVIGTGASAMQFVPAVCESVGELAVFQRSPQWILPNPNTNRTVSAHKRFLMAAVPHYLAWYRLRHAWNFGDRMHPMLQIDRNWPDQQRSINAVNERHRVFLSNYIHTQLQGRPDLIEKCVPTYPPYGKRPLLDHGWYQALKRDNVTLIAEAVTGVEPGAVVSHSGRRTKVDMIVLATGFKTLDLLGGMTFRGRTGRTLRATWGPDDARAYLGITVPAFPNFFILFGPNTNAGHGGSHFVSVELQVRYVIDVLSQMANNGLASVECTQTAFAKYNAEVDDALATTIWTHPGMTNYYRNSRGRIVTNTPWTNAQYWHRTRRADLEDYLVRRY